MDAVWQYTFYTDTSTVTVHIRRLRAKIEADPARPEHAPDGVGRRLPLPAVSGLRSAVLVTVAASALAGVVALVYGLRDGAVTLVLF